MPVIQARHIDRPRGAAVKYREKSDLMWRDLGLVQTLKRFMLQMFCKLDYPDLGLFSYQACQMLN